MKIVIAVALVSIALICSCSDKTYTENLGQSDWLNLYEDISLDEDIGLIKKKFPAITDWRTQEKDRNVYLWTSQKIFDTDASVAFIFKDKIMYQLKIYLVGLSDESAGKLFHSLKANYSESIKSKKQFCNNRDTNNESCVWLLESMTVYIKRLDNDKSKILFGFQKR